VDADALAKLNDLGDANFLVVGQSLKVPARDKPASAPAAAQPRTYTVVEGDTLWSIAQQFSTTPAALVEANQLEDADRLKLGMQLVLPGSAGPKPAAAASTVAAPLIAESKRSLMVAYTVQQGETLSQIARQFDMSVDAIARASGLEDANRIGVGTVLKVPVPG